MKLLSLCLATFVCHVYGDQPNMEVAANPHENNVQETYNPETAITTCDQTTEIPEKQLEQEELVSKFRNAETIKVTVFQRHVTEHRPTTPPSTTKHIESKILKESGAYREVKHIEKLQLEKGENFTEKIDLENVTESDTHDQEERCSGYRPDGSSQYQFQILAFGNWVTQKCHFGLVWNQELCRCDWAPNHQFETSVADGKCDLTLNITFSENMIRDYAKNAFINIDQHVNIRSNNRSDLRESHAGFFNRGLLSIQFFAGNSYSDMLRIELDFKRVGVLTDNSTEMVLLSNSCLRDQTNVTEATLRLALLLERNEVSLTVNEHLVTAKLTQETENWHHLEVLITKGTVVITDNEEQILNSNAFPARIQNSQCPLSIGGDLAEASKYFRGYIDDILLWRQCPPDQWSDQ